MTEISYRDTIRSPEALHRAVLSVHEVMVKEFPSIQHLAVRGTSGAAVAFAMSFAYGYQVCYIRKEDESHHGYLVENTPTRPYVIVDDFISSGNTVDTIISAIGETADCKAIILYGSGSFKRSIWRGTPVHFTSTYRMY